MHRSGPDNWDLIGEAYNSYCQVALRPRATRHELADMSQGREAINPDYLGPSTGPCFKGIKQKKTSPCSTYSFFHV